MAISNITGSSYSALLNSLQSQTQQSAPSEASTLQQELTQFESNISDPLLQDSVSIGGANDNSANTYNALGLLQGTTSQTTSLSASGTDGSTSDALANLLSENTSADAPSSPTDASSLSQALQKDPGMASVYVQNDLNQGLISIMS